MTRATGIGDTEEQRLPLAAGLLIGLAISMVCWALIAVVVLMM